MAPTGPPGDPGTAAAPPGVRRETPGAAVRSRGPGPAASPGPWSRVASTNLAEYAARLRAAGCPPETVCDILVPEIERRQTVRLDRAQLGESGDDFWSTGERRRELREEASRRRLAARDSEEQQFREIACRPSPQDFNEALTILLLEVLARFAGPEAPRQLVQWMGTAKLRAARWAEIPSDQLLPEERDWIRRDAAALQQQLATIFPGGQLEEFKLRLHMFFEYRFFRTSEALESLGLSGAEWREFCRIEQRITPDKLGEVLGFDNLLQEQPARPDPSTIEPDLQRLLGPERFARHQRGKDGPYQDTAGLAQAHGLPGDAPEQVRSLLQRWRQEVQSGRGLWDQDEARARPVLTAQRDRLRRELEAVLAAVPEGQRGGTIDRWIRNVFEGEWNKP